jgi:hypothetical protein
MNFENEFANTGLNPEALRELDLEMEVACLIERLVSLAYLSNRMTCNYDHESFDVIYKAWTQLTLIDPEEESEEEHYVSFS